MNYSTAIFLINDKVRAVKAIYDADVPGAKSAPRTTFKTFDPTIMEGDLVIVPTNTRHNFTVVKIVETDIEVDPHTHENLDWIVSVLDRSNYETVLNSEKQAINMIKQSEKTAQRNELKEKMLKHVDQTMLGSLSIANMSGEPQVSAIDASIEKAAAILDGVKKPSGYTA